jgi:predicted DNA-binding protein
MPDQKVTTIRQSPEQAAELEAIARVEGVPVAEVIRTAIAEHIEARRNDPAFRERLQRRLKEDQAILQKLADR